LIIAPEYFPRRRMSIATVAPKVRETIMRVCVAFVPRYKAVRMIEVGPMRTSKYVPSSSEKHSVLQSEQGNLGGTSLHRARTKRARSSHLQTQDASEAWS